MLRSSARWQNQIANHGILYETCIKILLLRVVSKCIIEMVYDDAGEVDRGKFV